MVLPHGLTAELMLIGCISDNAYNLFSFHGAGRSVGRFGTVGAGPADARIVPSFFPARAGVTDALAAGADVMG